MQDSVEKRPTLLWFRQDLRLSDNPALISAIKLGPVIPVFIWDVKSESPWGSGGATKWWYHHSLASLQEQLLKHQCRLVIRRGNSLQVLLELISETNAESVFWNRRYEPAIHLSDGAIHSQLTQKNIIVKQFSSTLLFEPESIRTRTRGPYQVFTPFYNACRALGNPSAPLPLPKTIPIPKRWPKSLQLSELNLFPKLPWANAFGSHWKPGREGAERQLKSSIAKIINEYSETRDNPTIDGTSRLSPHLHFGEIGIREVWSATEKLFQKSTLTIAEKNSVLAYQRQLIWREFSHHLISHFPKTPMEPLRKSFDQFPWCEDSRALKAWQQGLTGYPYIDAGMRQLWTTGWMHNRVRMATASFLVKHLLIPWQAGAQWFWDTLVDADLSQNTLGWQWVAGCGADAAPYFRIFHPVTQSEKFDPKGEYIKRWVPELAGLEGKWIHKPWEAPEEILKKAKVILGITYPKPFIDHAFARARALNAYHQIRKQK